MDTFNFTRKKLLKLPLKTRHHHIIQWLTKIYQAVSTNRIHPESYDLFTLQYQQVLDWSRMTPFTRPGSDHPRAWLEALSDRIHYHRGKTGIVLRDHDLLEKVATRDLENPRTFKPFNCHAALDGLRSLFNVGSIIRSCEAAGFQSVILGNTAPKDHPNIQKTAMGADKWIQIENTPDLAQTLLDKKASGSTIVGVETIQGACVYDEFMWQDQTILVFGNEEYGISGHVMDACDQFVHIPMYGRKNSINVANAASIICFHAARSLADQTI